MPNSHGTLIECLMEAVREAGYHAHYVYYGIGIKKVPDGKTIASIYTYFDIDHYNVSITVVCAQNPTITETTHVDLRDPNSIDKLLAVLPK